MKYLLSTVLLIWTIATCIVMAIGIAELVVNTNLYFVICGLIISLWFTLLSCIFLLNAMALICLPKNE
jgi:predicted cobalt transporter CbtA